MKSQASRVAIIAPGTGLGMACLVPGHGGTRVLASEGGHATLAATNAQEAALIDILRQRHGHVSAERALSGQGLMNLHAALADLQGVPVDARSAEQITRAAIDGSCRQSRLTLDVVLFTAGCGRGQRGADVRRARWRLHWRRHRAAHRRLHASNELPRPIRKQGKIPGVSGPHSDPGHRPTRSDVSRPAGSRGPP